MDETETYWHRQEDSKERTCFEYNKSHVHVCHYPEHPQKTKFTIQTPRTIELDPQEWSYITFETQYGKKLNLIFHPENSEYEYLVKPTTIGDGTLVLKRRKQGTKVFREFDDDNKLFDERFFALSLGTALETIKYILLPDSSFLNFYRVEDFDPRFIKANIIDRLANIVLQSQLILEELDFFKVKRFPPESIIFARRRQLRESMLKETLRLADIDIFTAFRCLRSGVLDRLDLNKEDIEFYISKHRNNPDQTNLRDKLSEIITNEESVNLVLYIEELNSLIEMLKKVEEKRGSPISTIDFESFSQLESITNSMAYVAKILKKAVSEVEHYWKSTKSFHEDLLRTTSDKKNIEDILKPILETDNPTKQPPLTPVEPPSE